MKFQTVLLGAAALALALPGIASAAGHAGQASPSQQVNHADHSNHGGQPQAGQGNASKYKSTRANGGNKYAGKPCPPGLAKKNPGCVPPGKWKRGDRLPEGWAGRYSAYNTLPQVFRDRYTNRTDRRFVYQNGKVFVINAANRAVVDILTR